MTPAAALLDELRTRGIELQATGGRLRFRPKAAVTPDLAVRLKVFKPALLGLLNPGPGDDAPPRAPEPAGDTHADREWRRFLTVCKPHPDGRGWYDPRELERLRRLTERPAARLETTQPEALEETAAERAARYRAEWERTGYPPGIGPRSEKGT